MNLSQTPLPNPAYQPPPGPGEFSLLLDHDGLRPVWGIALFVLLRELLRQFLVPLFAALFPSPAHRTLVTARSLYVYEIAALLCAFIATYLLAKLEGRTLSTYGFAPRHVTRNFLIGAATGVILLSLLVALLRASRLLVFDSRLLFGRHILVPGLLWAGAFLLVALSEEVLLRGYLQFTLTRALNPIFRRRVSPHKAVQAAFWIAAILLSIAFGSIHAGNPGESPLGLINAALIGMVFCLSLWRSGSLWWAIGFHAAWDWAQSFLYGVADSGLVIDGRLFTTHPVGRALLSGGLTGPEGSLFLLAIALSACAAIFATLPAGTPPPDRLAASDTPLDCALSHDA